MTDRPHWSYSALTQYLRCPLQYFFQRVLGQKPQFTPSSLALGSAVHQALAAYHTSLKDQRPINATAVRATFLDAWQTRKTQETIHLEDADDEDRLIAQGTGLLTAYLREPPPENIVAVEQELIAPLSNSRGEFLEKPIATVIDLIARPASGLKITDLKTSSRSYSAMDASLSLQATCYVNAVYENCGELPTFEYAVMVKTKLPRVQRIETTRTRADLGRLGDLVQTVDRAVEAGIFYPVESQLNCSSCPFRKPCREWVSGPADPESQFETIRTTESAMSAA